MKVPSNHFRGFPAPYKITHTQRNASQSAKLEIMAGIIKKSHVKMLTELGELFAVNVSRFGQLLVNFLEFLG